MPSFEALFRQSKGQPIQYESETLYLTDHLSVGKEFKLLVRLISTNSEWKQFVRLRVDKKGSMTLDGKTGKLFYLHEDDMPPEVEVCGTTKDGILSVSNGWIWPAYTKEYSDRTVNVPESFHNWEHGSAMKKEVHGNTIRYYCNDGHPDDNFDDIVFEVTLL